MSLQITRGEEGDSRPTAARALQPHAGAQRGGGLSYQSGLGFELRARGAQSGTLLRLTCR